MKHFRLFAAAPDPLHSVRMVRSGRLVFLLLVLVFSAGTLLAATGDEDRAFESAMDKFQSVPWLAEKDFAAFIQKYPNSPRLPEVILYDARAKLRSGEAAAAIELLATNQVRAGPLAPEYLYWIGIGQTQNSDGTNAAATFDQLWRKYPESARALDALIREAGLHAAQKNWKSAVQLFDEPDGPFQKAVRAGAKTETIASGYLLLGDARLALNDLDGVDSVLQALIEQPLSATMQWQQKYLSCRKQFAVGQLERALLDSADLLTAANPTNRAIGFDFQAGVLESMTNGSALENMTNLARAVADYTNNLATDVPSELQQRAILKISELDLKQPYGLTNATQTLSGFLAQFPESAAADQAMLALGELRLKQALSTDTNLTLGETNLFDKALVQFDLLANKFPNSRLLGKAYLDRGWCLWCQRTNDPTAAARFESDSLAAFSNAVVRLPSSEDQAQARFKWADSQLALRDFTGAITNYDYLVTNYASLPEAEHDHLIERALYQSMRAALDETNLVAATNSLNKILTLYPDSFFGPSSLLLAAQGLADQDSTDEARKLFAQFEQLYPTNSSIPDVALAIARSYEKDHDWEAAITNYAAWTNTFPHHPLLPAAKFNLARDNDMAGHPTNAFILFTNFIARFPADPLAAHAQYWLGDFYFRQGDYLNAEINYQLVFKNTNWAAASLTNIALTNLLPEAQMMAGRAAVNRFAYKQAISYFTNLLSSGCPTNFLIEATVAYADATINRQDSTNRPGDLNEAIKSLATVTNTQFGTWQAAQASGRIGDCYVQLGATDPNQYTNALSAYRMVLQTPGALNEAKNEARFAIGMVIEKQAALASGADQTALMQAALDQYANAFYEGLHDAGQPSPFWTEKSGLAAGQIAETLQRWDSAKKIYQQLKELLPVLGPVCDRKIQKADAHLTP